MEETRQRARSNVHRRVAALGKLHREGKSGNCLMESWNLVGMVLRGALDRQYAHEIVMHFNVLQNWLT